MVFAGKTRLFAFALVACRTICGVRINTLTQRSIGPVSIPVAELDASGLKKRRYSGFGFDEFSIRMDWSKAGCGLFRY